MLDRNYLLVQRTEILPQEGVVVHPQDKRIGVLTLGLFGRIARFFAQFFGKDAYENTRFDCLRARYDVHRGDLSYGGDLSYEGVRYSVKEAFFHEVVAECLSSTGRFSKTDDSTTSKVALVVNDFARRLYNFDSKSYPELNK